MKDSAVKWIAFAEENFACARIVAESGYYNSALQNAQQSVEKALKAVIVEKELEFRKTHSIQELRDAVVGAGVDVPLTDEECELLDSVYLPSKYPLGSALPESDPDLTVCNACTAIAEILLQHVHRLLA